MTIQQERFKDRKSYEAPEVEVIEVMTERVLNNASPYPEWPGEDI